MEQALNRIAAVPFTPQVFVQRKWLQKSLTVLSPIFRQQQWAF